VSAGRPRAAWCGPERREEGAASLLVALWMVVLVLLTGAGVLVVTVLTAHSTVSAAADLGALAGVSAALDGEDAACRRAGSVVRANGARLRGCRLQGAELWVQVEASASPHTAWLVRHALPVLRSHAHAVLVPADP
jgi:secretion/DNA translocation related TadE-like protein